MNCFTHGAYCSTNDTDIFSSFLGAKTIYTSRRCKCCSCGNRGWERWPPHQPWYTPWEKSVCPKRPMIWRWIFWIRSSDVLDIWLTIIRRWHVTIITIANLAFIWQLSCKYVTITYLKPSFRLRNCYYYYNRCI